MVVERGRMDGQLQMFVGRFLLLRRGSENEISSTPFVEKDQEVQNLQSELDFVAMARNGVRLKLWVEVV